jgi:DNA-directed RNA polymerase specialized sigma24 family protein
MSESCFNEEVWEDLYPLLHTRVTTWVFSSRLPLWMRQRNEIVEDIVQDALLKTFAFTKRVERGEACITDSLERICTVTAYHCYVDVLRRDRRLQPLLPEFEEPAGPPVSIVDTDPSELAIDNIYYELIFIQAARWIAALPEKQRAALLTDLANRMYFDPFHTTPLQDALAAVGIEMRDYQKPLPEDKQARARHAAHLSLAYKRLAFHAYVQRYAFVA